MLSTPFMAAPTPRLKSDLRGIEMDRAKAEPCKHLLLKSDLRGIEIQTRPGRSQGQRKVKIRP